MQCHEDNKINEIKNINITEVCSYINSLKDENTPNRIRISNKFILLTYPTFLNKISIFKHLEGIFKSKLANKNKNIEFCHIAWEEDYCEMFKGKYTHIFVKFEVKIIIESMKKLKFISNDIEYSPQVRKIISLKDIKNAFYYISKEDPSLFHLRSINYDCYDKSVCSSKKEDTIFTIQTNNEEISVLTDDASFNNPNVNNSGIVIANSNNNLNELSELLDNKFKSYLCNINVNKETIDYSKKIEDLLFQLELKNNELKEKNNIIKKNNEELIEKEDELIEKNNIIYQMEDLIKEKNNELEGKNNELEEKNNELEEKNNELEEKNNIIEEKNNESKQKNDVLKDKDKDNKIENIKPNNILENTIKNIRHQNTILKNNSIKIDDSDLDPIITIETFLINQLKYQNEELENKNEKLEYINKELKFQIKEFEIQIKEFEIQIKEFEIQIKEFENKKSKKK
jgi:hypothetical protein